MELIKTITTLIQVMISLCSNCHKPTEKQRVRHTRPFKCQKCQKKRVKEYGMKYRLAKLLNK